MSLRDGNQTDYFLTLGVFKCPEPIPSGLSFENSMTSLQGSEKTSFLDFVVGNMLCWVPERRKTAAELLRHSWLSDDEGDKGG